MIYLYRFTQYSEPNMQGSIVASWNFTSYEDPVSGVGGFPGVTFEPLVAITHADVRFSSEQSSGDLKVTVARDHPVALLFLAGHPASTLFLHVVELDEPGGTSQIFWRGRLRSCEFSEATAVLTCSGGNEQLQRLIIPISHAVNCQWVHYGERCGVVRAPYERTGTVVSVSADGQTVTTTLSEADNWFKAGLFKARGQSRMVLSNTGGVLTLMSAIGGLTAGDSLMAARGCDRSDSATSGCKAFNNFARFSGNRFPTPKNIFTDGVT